MKEINMTKAISCMPDKFITMEMVELAATEHRPELVNYLPEKYITSEILDSIFKTDDYGWRSWQLSKIPEEKRNRQICRKRLSKYIFYSSFSLLTFAAKKIISYDAAT